MTPKPVIRRQQAESDVLDAAQYYLEEGSSPLAQRFAEAIEASLASLARNPGSGSPRYAEWLQRPGLRFRQPRRFPYLIFYVERKDHIDVLRVLHASRDIPARLRDMGSGSDDHE